MFKNSNLAESLFLKREKWVEFHSFKHQKMTSFAWVRECLKKQQTFPVYFHDFYIALCTFSSRRIFFRKTWRLSQRQGTSGIKNGFRKSAYLTHVVPWPFISQHLRTESTWVYRKEGGNRRRKRYSGEFPFLCQDQQIKFVLERGSSNATQWNWLLRGSQTSGKHGSSQA